jgi:F-type H+-transporting ATPase subunit b
VEFNATLIGQSIAMLVFVWFCMKYIWPPLMGAIEARQIEIADGLAAAEKGQNRLSEAESEVSEIVSQAREQARGIMDQANTRADEIVEAARTEGEVVKQKQLDGARSEIEVEINRARDELRRQVAVIAVEGAQQILGREINADTHRDLLDGLATRL